MILITPYNFAFYLNQTIPTDWLVWSLTQAMLMNKLTAMLIRNHAFRFLWQIPSCFEANPTFLFLAIQIYHVFLCFTMIYAAHWSNEYGRKSSVVTAQRWLTEFVCLFPIFVAATQQGPLFYHYFPCFQGSTYLV